MDKISVAIAEKHVPQVYHIENTDINDFLFHDKVVTRYTHWMTRKEVLEEVQRHLRGARNESLTPLRPECHVCHYAGYSNDCEYSTTSCPLVELRKAVRKRGKGWTPR